MIYRLLGWALALASMLQREPERAELRAVAGEIYALEGAAATTARYNSSWRAAD